jgi:hypothetical protein
VIPVASVPYASGYYVPTNNASTLSPPRLCSCGPSVETRLRQLLLVEGSVEVYVDLLA